MRLNRTILQVGSSPIGISASLLERASTSSHRVLDLSQGAPNRVPPPSVVARIAQVAMSPDGHRYTERRGLPRLRALFADELSGAYGCEMSPESTLITAGCNQAFCLAIASTCEPGDEVLIVAPYYFNHDMWLRASQVTPVYVQTDDELLPIVQDGAAKVTAKTRAIVIVTPGNPTGKTIPPEVIDELADLADASGAALIIDETYRSFRQGEGPPHHLFRRRNWESHVVSLHSFSKDFAIPGCRVGVLVAGPDLLDQASKIFDCIAICAPRLGQEGACAALENETAWRDEQVLATHRLQASFTTQMARSPGGFRLASAGAFYAWVEHPFKSQTAESVTNRLFTEAGILALPGSVFTESGGDRYLRFSFANLDDTEVPELVSRLDMVGI